MHKNIKILLLAITFSFIWGIWWGHYKKERANPRFKNGPEIRLLAVRGLFTPQFLKEFQKKNTVQIVLTEKDTDGEVLRDALSRNADYDLIQMSSFISKSFIVDNVFAPLDMDEVSHFSSISVDFKSLDFDLDNHYFAPISWGINGFLINAKKISLVDETLGEMLNAKSKATVLPSPVELFNIAIKLKPIIKTWVETGQAEELKKEIKELKTIFSSIVADPREKLTKGEFDIVQVSNGRAAKLLGRDSPYRFVLPKERATLWLNLIGVSRGAKDKEFAFDVLNQFLEDNMNRRLVELSEQATPLESLNSSELPLVQKASFIRQLPLSRVELFINHEALESTWLEALRREWPNL